MVLIREERTMRATASDGISINIFRLLIRGEADPRNIYSRVQPGKPREGKFAGRENQESAYSPRMRERLRSWDTDDKSTGSCYTYSICNCNEFSSTSPRTRTSSLIPDKLLIPIPVFFSFAPIKLQPDADFSIVSALTRCTI